MEDEEKQYGRGHRVRASRRGDDDFTMKEDGLYDDDDEYMDDPSLVKEDEGSEFEGSMEDRKRKPKGKAARKPKDSSKNWE